MSDRTTRSKGGQARMGDQIPEEKRSHCRDKNHVTAPAGRSMVETGASSVDLDFLGPEDQGDGAGMRELLQQALGSIKVLSAQVKELQEEKAQLLGYVSPSSKRKRRGGIVLGEELDTSLMLMDAAIIDHDSMKSGHRGNVDLGMDRKDTKVDRGSMGPSVGLGGGRIDVGQVDDRGDDVIKQVKVVRGYVGDHF